MLPVDSQPMIPIQYIQLPETIERHMQTSTKVGCPPPSMYPSTYVVSVAEAFGAVKNDDSTSVESTV